VGRTIALSLADQGCDVVVHYHTSAEAAEATASGILGRGVRALPVRADLQRMEGISALFQAIDQAFGGLDLLVNSAAVMVPGELLRVSPPDWQRTVGLNLRGTFFVLQLAAERMRRRGGGSIVNISDVAGLRPWKRYPLHSISKAGVEMLTQVAALSLAPEVRVNAVAPGPVLKPDGMAEGRWEEIARDLPLQRGGSPEDIARAVVFLFENDFITGETLVVDGGSTWV
jgi:pteridine reductase